MTEQIGFRLRWNYFFTISIEFNNKTGHLIINTFLRIGIGCEEWKMQMKMD